MVGHFERKNLNTRNHHREQKSDDGDDDDDQNNDHRHNYQECSSTRFLDAGKTPFFFIFAFCTVE